MTNKNYGNADSVN